jgi:23S rRNA (adenine1618-N6)-methyltransferase
LSHRIDLRKQPDPHHKFTDIIRPDEYFDLTICNPPFHDSAEQAEHDAKMKLTHLKKCKVAKWSSISAESPMSCGVMAANFFSSEMIDKVKLLRRM